MDFFLIISFSLVCFYAQKNLKMVVAYTIRQLTIIPGKLSLSFFYNEFQKQSDQWGIIGAAKNYQFCDNHRNCAALQLL